MSMYPDDGLGLSPAERDFALRRMPVNDPLVEAYHAANVVPDAAPPLTLSKFKRHEIEARASNLRLLARDLDAVGLADCAGRVRRVADEIREALK